MHIGEESYDAIQSAIDAAGVKIVFLPAYSPELDAGEFVFQEIKKVVRRHRTPEEKLWIDTLLACSTITHTKMFSFYQQALYDWGRGL